MARRASSGILALEMLVTKVRLSMQYAALSRAMVLSLPIFYAHQRIALMRFFIVPALTASAFHCPISASTCSGRELSAFM